MYLKYLLRRRLKHSIPMLRLDLPGNPYPIIVTDRPITRITYIILDDWYGQGNRSQYTHIIVDFKSEDTIRRLRVKNDINNHVLIFEKIHKFIDISR